MARLSEIPRENLEFMAQDIGKELIPFLAPEMLVARLTSQERVAGLPLQERVAGISAKEEKELLEYLLKKHQPQSNGA